MKLIITGEIDKQQQKQESLFFCDQMQNSVDIDTKK